jgi:hypothetical protein
MPSLRAFASLTAALAPLVLAACLDDSLPLAPAAQGRDTTRIPSGGPAGPAKEPVQPGPLDLFGTSLEALHRMQAANQGNYVYTRVAINGGDYESTLVTVEAGRVTRRVAQTEGPDHERPELLLLRFGHAEESAEAGNLGQAPFGAPPLTLDSLYQQCRTALIAAEGRDLRFTTDRFGILAECGAVPAGCGEACHAPIRIVRTDWFYYEAM